MELKINANKNPQMKLQPGALQSLQKFLQNLWGRELLGEMTQHSFESCLNLRNGCFFRCAEQLPTCLWKTSFNPSHLTSIKWFFPRKRTWLQEHKWLSLCMCDFPWGHWTGIPSVSPSNRTLCSLTLAQQLYFRVLQDQCIFLLLPWQLCC